MNLALMSLKYLFYDVTWSVLRLVAGEQMKGATGPGTQFKIS